MPRRTSDEVAEIEIRKWTRRGIMLVATDGLEPEDPDHPYNQALAQGVVPENFGLVDPLDMAYAHLSRADLIRRVRELERENNALERALA